MNVNNVLKTLKEHPEGFSVDVDTMRVINPPSGVVVSVTNFSGTLEDLPVLWSRAVKTACSLGVSHKIVGVWHDGNKCYVDAGVLVNSIETALVLARVFNQKAVYDFTNKTVVNTD